MKSAVKKNLQNVTLANKDAAQFAVTVHAGGEIGPYEVGHKLTETRMIADYFRQHAEMDPDKATDAQIVAVVKSVGVKDMDDEAANEARLSAVVNAPFANADTSEIPSTSDVLPMEGTNFGYAMQYGALVDDTTIGGITKAIEGEKDKLAGPVLTAHNLRRQFGSVMIGNTPFLDTVPPIGTRFQKSKGDKAPYGYRVPTESSDLPVYQGPWQHTLIESSSTVGPAQLKRDWIAYFVMARMGKETADLVDHCRAALKGATKENCPPFIRAMVDNKEKLQSVLDDYAFQFNRQVRIVGQAFKLIQRERAIEERFSSNGIKVELIGVLEHGESVEDAARRTKPFTVTTQRKLGDGRFTTDKSTTLALSRILNLEPAKFPENTKVATLIAVKRGTKGGAEKNKGQPGAMVSEISTTDKLEEYLSAVSNYADKAENLAAIRKRINSPENGGKLASDLVGTYDLLAAVVTDDVRKLARGYDDNATKALAMAAAAKAKETKAA